MKTKVDLDQIEYVQELAGLNEPGLRLAKIFHYLSLDRNWARAQLSAGAGLYKHRVEADGR